MGQDIDHPSLLLRTFEGMQRKLRGTAAPEAYSIYVDISGRNLALRFLRKEQAAIIERCLAGRLVPKVPAPDGCFHFWADDCSRYISWRDDAPRQRVQDANGWIVYAPDRWLLGARPLQHTFYYCVHSYETALPIPYWAVSSLVYQWARTEALLPLHGAAVGVDGRGVLLVARGGGGKSTLAISCLLAGMDFVGDDYLLVSAHGPLLAMPLFSMIKLNLDMKTQMEVDLPVIWSDPSRGGKQVLDASTLPLCQELPLHAVVFLSRANQDLSVVKRSPPGPTAARLAQAALQETGSYAPATTRMILQRLSRLPSFEMVLGTDLKKNTEMLRTLIERIDEHVSVE